MMNSRGIKVATIRGIELNLHVSLIFLMAYVVFVSMAQFPLVAEDAGIHPIFLTGGPLGWGITFAVGLLLSIVAHEFGHAIVAQRAGIKVRSITLMMLGGAASIEKIPEERPYFEFKLAVVGPLVSFVIAGLMFALYEYTESANMALFGYWLGSANMVLGVFNLLPAFPLDGGRALRSLLVARKGMIRGTRVAVRVSQVFAWGLGIFGFLQFNFLLVFVAVFIHATAKSELFHLISNRLLKGLSVSEVAVRTEVVDPRDTLQNTAARMLTGRNVVLPVQNSGEQAFTVTLDRIRSVPRERWASTLVHEIMTRAPRLVDMKDQITSVLVDVAAAPSQVLPVGDGPRTVGYLRYSDVANLLQLRTIDESDDDHSRRPTPRPTGSRDDENHDHHRTAA